jgi:RNA-directed DNA polymerase
MKRLPASLSAEAIEKVWKGSRDAQRSKAGASGVDRIEAFEFRLRLRENIAQLRLDIRKDSYRFKPLRLAPIVKASGGYRIIAIPTVRDRLVQRALLDHLERDNRFSLISPISYGFTKGRSLADAQKQALALRQTHPWVLKADIIKFFDQIPRNQIKALIRKRVRSKIVSGLLCAAVDCELEDGTGRLAQIARDNGIKRGRGLRQGMPVSPLLSNLLLKEFDEALAKQKLHAVRYADDIAIFADNRNECRDALKIIQGNLKSLNLEIPELADGGKTVIFGPSEPVEFLGVEIKRFGDIYELRAPASKIAKIEADMAVSCSIEQCVKEKKNIGQVVQGLESFVIGHQASMAILDNRDDFVARLQAAKNKQLKSLLISLVGENVVQRLDESRLAILGLQPFA